MANFVTLQNLAVRESMPDRYPVLTEPHSASAGGFRDHWPSDAWA